MSALGGFVTGVVALSLLDAVVSSDTAVNNATGIFGTAANLVNRLADPFVPAIPDRRSSSASTTAAPTAPAAPAVTAGYTQPASRLPVST
ncbi:MAG: hypothetical protein JWQ32_2069 [Marmoricola sp.]|nr:hypothetical protein [Marmoricola sp.]